MMKKDETAFCGESGSNRRRRDADGAPVCRVVMSDITTRKRAEQTLPRAEQALRLAQDARTGPAPGSGTANP